MDKTLNYSTEAAATEFRLRERLGPGLSVASVNAVASAPVPSEG